MFAEENWSLSAVMHKTSNRYRNMPAAIRLSKEQMKAVRMRSQLNTYIKKRVNGCNAQSSL